MERSGTLPSQMQSELVHEAEGQEVKAPTATAAVAAAATIIATSAGPRQGRSAHSCRRSRSSRGGAWVI